jgi:hypothetical protein
MESDVFKVLLCHTQNVTAVGQEYITAILILGHVLVLAFLEVVELLWVIALNPAGFVKVYGLPAAFGVVFVL